MRIAANVITLVLLALVHVEFQLLFVTAANSSSGATEVTKSPCPSASPVAVIGAGFSGLTAALELRRHGYNVTVFERHNEVGGRARAFEMDGVSFDA